ncbi:hypothetical protein DPMN_191504 [Dreissena polymorpha]|uniref:Uncharacterized protein n=1 Tax=Dreissena polymorpha TaxID=45954 RepID=A0A9D3XZV3_DREPO|nr:hypothetical protein DPMN_191504 [Dreissena polymorpha]
MPLVDGIGLLNFIWLLDVTALAFFLASYISTSSMYASIVIYFPPGFRFTDIFFWHLHVVGSGDSVSEILFNCLLASPYCS